jgi:hypothetical protein
LTLKPIYWSMTDQQETKPSNNKGIIIFGIIFGIVGLTALAIVGALFLGAPDVTSNPEDTDNSSQQSTGELTSKDIPEVTNFTVNQEPNTFKAGVDFTVANFADDLYVEYRIENDDKRILVDGLVNTGESVHEDLQLSAGDKTISLKMRVSNTDGFSNWETVQYADVAAPEGDTKRERPVNDAYFETPWALGTDKSITGLETALTTAYGIDRVQPADYCSYGNDDQIKPGEIFPPRPAYIENYNLKYEVLQTAQNDYKVIYYWCE